MKIEKKIDILVRRIGALGDVVYTTGVVRELYKKYQGNARITVQTDFPDVYANNPYVHHVVNSETGLTVGAFDLFINLDDAYEFNPDNHYLDSYFYKAFGENNLDHSSELFPSAKDQAEVDADLQVIGDKFIAVHMRQWHWELKNIAADVWFKVFEEIYTERTDYKVVFVGGSSDGHIPDHPLMFNCTGRYTPAQLKYLLDHAACFVGIDSGPYAIATASKCNVVALLSHMVPDNIIPINNDTKVVQADVECVGCYVRQARPVRGIVCERGDFACNRTWQTEKISQSILKYMK